MDVLVKANDGFVHGDLHLDAGQEVVMDDMLARQLSHLVTVQAAPRMVNKMLPDSLAGNDVAVGKDAQLPSSPAAPASPKATAKASELGAKKATTEK